MVHVALIGASGHVGSRILQELSDRNHQVTAISRHPEQVKKLPGVVAVAGDSRQCSRRIAALNTPVLDAVPCCTAYFALHVYQLAASE